MSTFSIGPCAFYVDEFAPVRLRVWYSSLDGAWHVSVRRETWDEPVDFTFARPAGGKTPGRWNLFSESGKQFINIVS